MAATSTTPGARATTATSMGEVDGEDGEREDDDDGGGSGGDGDGDDKGIHLQTCMVGLFRFFCYGFDSIFCGKVCENPSWRLFVLNYILNRVLVKK